MSHAEIKKVSEECILTSLGLYMLLQTNLLTNIYKKRKERLKEYKFTFTYIQTY